MISASLSIEINLNFINLKGDAGFVPRVTDKILTNQEKMKTAYPLREQGLQRVVKKTVSTQTIDFVKASLFGFESPNNLTDRAPALFKVQADKRIGKKLH